MDDFSKIQFENLGGNPHEVILSEVKYVYAPTEAELNLERGMQEHLPVTHVETPELRIKVRTPDEIRADENSSHVLEILLPDARGVVRPVAVTKKLDLQLPNGVVSQYYLFRSMPEGYGALFLTPHSGHTSHGFLYDFSSALADPIIASVSMRLREFDGRKHLEFLFGITCDSQQDTGPDRYVHIVSLPV